MLLYQTPGIILLADDSAYLVLEGRKAMNCDVIILVDKGISELWVELTLVLHSQHSHKLHSYLQMTRCAQGLRI